MNDYLKERKEALEYRAMSEGYDGRMITELLNLYLKPGSTLLEIGMGPGKDLDILAEKYRVTGSDISKAFLDLYREKHPRADLLQLGASTLMTDRRFDCIYSNKVLHQISPEALKDSFKRQQEVLLPAGLACHSFWYGDKVVQHREKQFWYYTEETIQPFIKDKFELVFHKKFMEMIPDDSIVFILRRCS